MNTENQPVEIKKTNIKQYTSTILKKNYTFQRVSPSAWLDILDKVDNNKENKNRTLYSEVLENIVVQPKLTLDDFENSGELDEVVKAAINFQRGK